MAVSAANKQSLFMVGLILLTVGTTLLLNLPTMFFEPLVLWLKLGIPGALALGAVGAVRQMKPLLFVGWLGIVGFVLVALLTAVPGEDYVLGGASPPNLVSGTYVLLRLLLFLCTAVLLAVCLRKVAAASKSSRS